VITFTVIPLSGFHSSLKAQFWFLPFVDENPEGSELNFLPKSLGSTRAFGKKYQGEVQCFIVFLLTIVLKSCLGA